MDPFTVEIHPLTHPCPRHVTIDLIYLSQKASNYPEPTDRPSFGRVQIYHQNRSSVLRSQDKWLSNYLLNRKIVVRSK